jgi:hypothetical protein
MNRWTALALGAFAAALACGAVAVIQRDECLIEGAYFNRSVGAPAYAGVFEPGCTGFSLANPNLWLGAAVAFAVMSVAILAAARLRRGGAG